MIKILQVATLMLMINISYACSPYAIPTLLNQNIVGNNLVLNWQSNIPWACTYTITTEISCLGGAQVMPQQISGSITKGSAAPQAYPGPQTIDISGLCAGEVYQFRAKDGGSQWTTFFTFTVGGNPFGITLLPDNDTVCVGSCTNIVGNASSACNAVNYVWAGGFGVNPTINVCPNVTTNYTLTATTNGICGPLAATQNVTVEVIEYPIGGVANSFPEHVCEGDPSAVSLNGSVGNIQWQSGPASVGPWTDILNENTTTLVPISTMVDVYYQAVVSNFCGSELSTITQIYAEPYPDIGFIVQDDCIYNPAQFQNLTTINTGNIINWTWDFGDQFSGFQEHESHYYATPGIYNGSLTAVSDYNCMSDSVFQIEINPSPTSLFAMNDDCEYNAIDFANYSSVIAPDNIVSVLYDFGDGSPFSAVVNPTHLYPGAGTYNVTQIVTTNNGCTENLTLPVTLFPKPSAEFASTVVCENTPPTVFTHSAGVASGTINLYDWSFGDGISSVLENPTHIYDEDGVFSTVLIVHSDHNCTDTIEHTVTVLSKPTSALIVDLPESCNPLCTDFTDLSIANGVGITSYQWSFGNGETSAIANPNVCFENLSNTSDTAFNVQLITENNLGCFDTLLLVDYINVWHNPISSFYPDPTEASMYHPNIEFINESVGADEYLYDFGDGETSYDFEPLPYHIFPDTGFFDISLIVFTDHNCRDTSYQSIEIIPTANIYVPNTFTPDGDGINDVVKYIGYGIVEQEFEFLIFDRWGLLIYETDRRDNAWDGTYKGGEAQQDTYVYKLKCKDVLGKHHDFIGHINLLR